MHHQKNKRANFFAILIVTLAFLTSPSNSAIATPPEIPVLFPIWTSGDYSEPASFANIIVEDIDNDGQTEIVSCNTSSPFATKSQPTGDYELVWLGEMVGCANIVTADADSDNVFEIYVGTKSGFVVAYDGATFEKLREINLEMAISEFINAISDITAADVDNDGDLEIVATGYNSTQVIDAKTFAVEWDPGWFGGKEVVVGNIDDEPMPEIIVNSEAVTQILDAITQTDEWRWEGSFGQYLELGDVDGDLRAEIVAIKDTNLLSVYDADTRTLKWAKRDPDTETAQMPIKVVDLNGDGLADVAGGASSYARGYHGATGELLWTIPNYGSGFTAIGVGDTDQDGLQEVIWRGTSPGAFCIGSPQTQTIEWNGEDIDGPLIVAAGDIDNNGDQEFVVASTSADNGSDGSLLRVFSPVTHEVEWQNDPLRTYLTVSQMDIGQLDADPALEILLSGARYGDMKFVIYDGQTQAIERSFIPLEHDDAPIDVLLSDLNGDNRDEIIVALNTQDVMVFNGETFTTLWRSGVLDGPIVDLSVGDMDNDSVKDLAILTTQGIYAYETAAWSETYQAEFAGYEQFALMPDDTLDVSEILLVQANPYGYKTLVSWDAANGIYLWKEPLGKTVVNDLLVLDFDGNSSREFVLLGNSGDVSDKTSLLWVGASQSPVDWKFRMAGRWGSLNSLALDDFNQDAAIELILGSENLVQHNVLASIPAPYKIFLPLVHGEDDACHIYGTVTEKGVPAADVQLRLAFYNGIFWQYYRDTTTDQNGKYCFNYVDTLVDEKKYRVEFFVNYDQYPHNSRLQTWYTRALTSYERGSEVNIGNFDIANVYLESPGEIANITLPKRFSWIPRSFSPDDVYELIMLDSVTDAGFSVMMPAAGDSDYFLTDIPPGFNLFDWCFWKVKIHSPDGGVGYSYDEYEFAIIGDYP